MTVEITTPGIYDLPADVYQADPVPGGSLSSTGARKLLPPSCPALYDHWRRNGEVTKHAWDIGHAAHKVVLGAGPELVVVNRDRWDTKEVKAEVKAIRAAGNVPLKPADHDMVQTMAAELRQHPIAAELLDPATMLAEQSIFWIDGTTGMWCRARLDAVSKPDGDQPPIVVDYKSCRSADLSHISRALHEYGYALQAAWYLDAAAAVDGLGGLVKGGKRFLFVFQEVAPPHLVTVIEPDANALAIGVSLARQALEIYRDCAAAGQWPGHVAVDEIPLVGLPGWVERQHNTDYVDEGIL